MSAPVLRHAGSANQERPGSDFGNQQFAGQGIGKRCDDCGKHRSIGTGWGRFGFNRVFWRCPQCVDERVARKSVAA